MPLKSQQHLISFFEAVQAFQMSCKAEKGQFIDRQRLQSKLSQKCPGQRTCALIGGAVNPLPWNGLDFERIRWRSGMLQASAIAASRDDGEVPMLRLRLES